MRHSKLTKEEYDNLQDTVTYYEMAYCLATDDFYYAGPYTNKCDGDVYYTNMHGDILENNINRLMAIGIDELLDPAAYFFYDVREVNEESVREFLDLTKAYINQYLQIYVNNYNNLDNKSLKDIESA